MGSKSAINTIYNERKEFVIIGLTGRTGSGCSTVANILGRADFNDLDLKTPKDYDFKNSDERKYTVLYNYAKANNWGKFEIITMSNIIASFIFEEKYNEFEKYIKQIINDETKSIKVLEEIKFLEEEFNEIKDYMADIEIKFDEEKKDISIDSISRSYNELYMKKIPKLSKKLKDIFKNHIYLKEGRESQLYTYLFQEVGNNIRASGEPYISEFKTDNFFALAKRTKRLIKSISKCNKKDGKGTFICIDAIRTPYEAIYFRDRYSAFYLFSINTDDSIRRKRLSTQNFKENEIKSLDSTEYPKKLKGKDKFCHQDIGTCLEIADVHIYNPESEDSKYFFLTEQILKYVMLMMHPGLITPTHMERCMQIAYNAKLNSGCLSRQVGAVITGDDYSIKSVGWNEVPKGQVSCGLRDVKQYCCNKDKETYSNYEITEKKFFEAMEKINSGISYDDLGGRAYPYCFKDIYNALEAKNNQVHTRALHAEENAFLQISKYGGVGIQGGYLFTTASPCELCAKKAYHLGIKKIIYIDPYPGISQNHILRFGDKGNPEMHLFYGAIGNAYMSLYSQRISFKDDIEVNSGERDGRTFERVIL